MSTPFIAEIRMFAGNFAPRGWMFCSGQILSIAQNSALFSLLGTTYGGNGITTFALPDFRGRAPLHPGQGPGLSNYVLGDVVGTESVTLTSNQMPAHNHVLNASSADGNARSPAGALLAHEAGEQRGYQSGGADTTLAPAAVGVSGSSQPHSNVQPSLAVHFIIATEGIFPSRN